MEYEIIVSEGPHTGRIFSYAGGRDLADRLATQCRREFGSATVRRIWGAAA
jgi:hypothetical protein